MLSFVIPFSLLHCSLILIKHSYYSHFELNYSLTLLNSYFSPWVFFLCDTDHFMQSEKDVMVGWKQSSVKGILKAVTDWWMETVMPTVWKAVYNFMKLTCVLYKLMHTFREENTRWKKVASMRTAIKCVWGKSFRCSLFLRIIKDRLGREQEGLFTSADTRTTKYVKITALGIKIEVEMCWNNFLNCKQHWGFQHPSGVCQVCILLGKEPTAFICQSHRCIKITTATTSAK